MIEAELGRPCLLVATKQSWVKKFFCRCPIYLNGGKGARASQVWPESPSLFLLTSPGHNSNNCPSFINKISSTSYSSESIRVTLKNRKLKTGPFSPYFTFFVSKPLIPSDQLLLGVQNIVFLYFFFSIYQYKFDFLTR